MAIKSNAKAIIIGSLDETLATTVSSFRPDIPVIAITKKLNTAQLLALVWGVTPLVTTNKNLLKGAKKILTDTGNLKKGEKIIYLRDTKTITIETI
jgi:pyruvate kinase